MKIHFSFIVLLFILPSLSLYSQKVLNNGEVKSVLSTKLANGMVVETNIQTDILNNDFRIIVSSSNGNSTVIKKENRTTSFSTVMGKKIGFYLIDTTSASSKTEPDSSFKLTLLDSSKVLNGYNCKKATISYLKNNDPRNDVQVWYCPDFVFTNKYLGINVQGIDQIPGFPLNFSTSMKNGMSVSYFVTSVDTSVLIDQKNLVVPKEYAIYSFDKYKEEVSKMMK